MPSFRALQCLVAVADSGSITEAARLLYLSQPAVSHQISVLEKEVGTSMLRREPRGVRLTPAGRAAVGDARRAIEAAAAAIRAAREAGRAAGGILRLAGPENLTVPLLAPIIGQWHVRYPKIHISLRESSSIDQLLGLIEAEEVDLAVVPGPAPVKFESSLIADEEMVLALHHGYPLVDKESVSLSDLDGRPLVQFASDNALSGWLDGVFARAGVRPEIAMKTSVTTTAPELAAAGLGIAVCPVSTITSGFSGRVRSFSPRLLRPIMAVTAAEPDASVKKFAEHLRDRGIRIPRKIQDQLTSGV